jgi:hypothetical protein
MEALMMSNKKMQSKTNPNPKAKPTEKTSAIESTKDDKPTSLQYSLMMAMMLNIDDDVIKQRIISELVDDMEK